MSSLAFTLWRRLPARPRQRLAHALFAAMRPRLPPWRPPDPAGPALPIVVVGFLSSPSGLGQAARLAAAAFARQGRQVYGIDLGRFFYEGAGRIAHGLPDGRTLAGPAHVLVNINAPYLPYALWLLGRRFLAGKHVTGYWAWELPHLPPNWRRGFDCVHDIAVPSAFVADAVRAFDATRPVVVAPHPVALETPPPRQRRPLPYSPGRPFIVISVLNVASGFERKNPLALIRAFRQAFGDAPDCRLRLLVTNADHFAPARPRIEKQTAGSANIEIAWDSLDRKAFLDWWQTPDVYASLHRAEGFGLPLAEAMASGCLVMATGWSGNLQFMNAGNSLLVDYAMVPVRDEQAKYPAGSTQWAEPDVAHAARLLREARAHYPEHRARAGRQRIIDDLGAGGFCDGIDSLLAQMPHSPRHERAQ
jgi:glycosyltransferase involved in cell wall biosynthesis